MEHGGVGGCRDQVVERVGGLRRSMSRCLAIINLSGLSLRALTAPCCWATIIALFSACSMNPIGDDGVLSAIVRAT